jgi:hypothetical protein
LFISAWDKITIARKLLLLEFDSVMVEERIDPDYPVLKILFVMGFRLYIRYNPSEQYSYHIDFSKKQNNRIRFDNYDDKWEVTTRPHHKHVFGVADVVESPMNGEPTHDIPILIKEISALIGNR